MFTSIANVIMCNRPRMTLKLRRIDRGIQFKSGQEWQWKGRMEKKRTRFNM